MMAGLTFPLIFFTIFTCFNLSLGARYKRYSGATNAQPGAWPSQVLIKMGRNKGLICGGTILNEEWILTAGHCLRSSEGQKPLKYKLIFGEYDRSRHDGTEVYSGISEVHSYPKYETVGHSYDMALAKLDTPLNFSDPKQKHLKPICLNLSPLNTTNLKCVATGFGPNREGGYMPDILRELEMKAIDLKVCADLHPKFHKHERVIDTHICAVSKATPPPNQLSTGAACYGDSGGPLQCLVSNEWYQIGVAWSVTKCTKNPTVFNRVDKYADWIVKVSGYKLPERCTQKAKL